MADTTDRPIVVASNRGPVSFVLSDGELEVRRGGGGLVTGLGGLAGRDDTVWIAAAMGDGDRTAHDRGLDRAHGASLLTVDADDYERYYDRVSNELLWFAHHHLFDLTYAPSHDQDAQRSWDAYRRVNGQFAAAIAEQAPSGAIVLVQDYHLSLVPADLRARRDDVSIVHFHHTPFATPAFLASFPDALAVELLEGLAGAHSCGFHSRRWVDDFLDCCARFGVEPPATFVAPLSVDPAPLRESARGERVDAEFARLDAAVADATFVVRVDRIELSKNLLRGFSAFAELLERREDLRGRIVFGAFCYPSRGGVEDYRRYRERIEAEVASINDRYGTSEWTPILLETDDNYPRSLAALRRADVLVVNAIRDGLNLVAKEGAILGERHPSLVLSTETGAYEELADLVDGVHPFDVTGTASAIERALERTAAERESNARALVEVVTSRTPDDWLGDQLASVS